MQNHWNLGTNGLPAASWVTRRQLRVGLNPRKTKKLRRRNQECFIAPPPPRSTWSIAIGPPPKKIKANARAARERVSS